jgi:hypothetical protein
MFWAVSQTARVMIAGCTGSVLHSHWSGGTGWPRLPAWVRRRPNTMCPVYFGLPRIETTPPLVHPVASSGGGQVSWSALRRVVISGMPSLSTVRQV